MINDWLAMLTFLLLLVSFLCLANRNFKVWVILQALYGLNNYYRSGLNNDLAGMMVSVVFLVVLRMSCEDAFSNSDIESFNARKFKLVFFIYLGSVVAGIYLNFNKAGVVRPVIESALLALPILFTNLLNHKLVVGWIFAYLYYFILSLLWFMEYTYEYYLVFSGINITLAFICIYGFYKWTQYEKEITV